MKPTDVSKLPSFLGPLTESRWLFVVVLLVVVVVVVVAVVYVRRKATGAGKKEIKLPIPLGSPGQAPADTAKPPKLREAWQTFAKGLPSHYRRSILNFDHYVMFVDAPDVRNRVVDVYTDWQRQRHQFLKSEPEGELPVYIASRAVVMVIPENVLLMNGQDCKQALTKLWQPLYEQKSPVVVVALHGQQFLHKSLADIQDFAGALRGKINLLASIRKKPVEVRVVLTHLDSEEGYSDVTDFCCNSGIPLRIGLRNASNVEAALTAWYDGMKAQLPRMLMTVDTPAYGRILRFLNDTTRLTTKIGSLYTSLFAHEAMSQAPIRGDLYLATKVAGSSNPLEDGDRTAGPDPRMPHLIAAAVLAGASMAMLGTAFVHQYSEWSAAHDSLKDYDANSANLTAELRRRRQILAFTQENESFLDTHPDFFASPRVDLRKQFSERIRQSFLIPRLREAARAEIPERGQPLRVHQKCLYLLGLIHSAKNDVLSIKSTRDANDRNRLVLWSSMTGIEPDLIRDYLDNTDEPDLRAAVGLDVREVDPYDTKRIWQGFMDDIKKAMADGVVSIEELDKLQNEAKDLEPHIVRLRNADIVLSILPELDRQRRSPDAVAEDEEVEVAETANGLSNGLSRKYTPAFGKFLDAYKTFEFTDVSELSAVLSTVRDTGLSIDQERGLLTTLLVRLGAVLRQRTSGAANGRLVQLDFEANVFNEMDWHASIRDAKVHMLIESFTKTATERDIFFDPNETLNDTTWNPTGSAAAVFSGRQSISGKLTREMYDTRVRRPVLALSEFLDNVKIPENDRQDLTQFVHTGVRRYATNLRSEMLEFIRGFELNVSSPEELRVALTQMSAETGGTSFDEFLKIVDRDTRLNAKSSKTGTTEYMLAPAEEEMKAFDAWHGVVDQEKGAPKIIEYKKILQQLLIDLGGSLEAVPGANATQGKEDKGDKGEGASGEKKKDERTLETDLTPTGRVFLSSLLDRKGAYSSLIRAWIQGTNLPPAQQRPFVLPLYSIEATGRRDVETVIEQNMQREVMRDLERIVLRFPFDRTAREEVTPKEMNDLFHPKEGRVYDFFRRYLEPVSNFGGEGGFRIKPTVRGVRISKNIYDILNASVLLSSQLWDDAGKPRPLDYRVITVPFNKEFQGDDALTVVYLNVGEGSLFNFNQKNTAKTMSIDWTKTGSSQIGIQLTNTETKDNAFPDPIVRSGSHFSFLRLLTATPQPPDPVKEPPTAQLYTWTIVLRNNQRFKAQIVLKNDPWEAFVLEKVLKRSSGR